MRATHGDAPGYVWITALILNSYELDEVTTSSGGRKGGSRVVHITTVTLVKHHNATMLKK